jgi:hypothetical protein
MFYISVFIDDFLCSQFGGRASPACSRCLHRQEGTSSSFGYSDSTSASGDQHSLSLDRSKPPVAAVGGGHQLISGDPTAGLYSQHQQLAPSPDLGPYVLQTDLGLYSQQRLTPDPDLYCQPQLSPACCEEARRRGQEQQQLGSNGLRYSLASLSSEFDTLAIIQKTQQQPPAEVKTGLMHSGKGGGESVGPCRRDGGGSVSPFQWDSSCPSRASRGGGGGGGDAYLDSRQMGHSPYGDGPQLQPGPYLTGVTAQAGICQQQPPPPSSTPQPQGYHTDYQHRLVQAHQQGQHGEQQQQLQHEQHRSFQQQQHRGLQQQRDLANSLLQKQHNLQRQQHSLQQPQHRGLPQQGELGSSVKFLSAEPASICGSDV